MKILLAVDGSEYAKNAAKECLRLLRLQSGSTLKILSVADDTQPMGADHLGVAGELYQTLRDRMTEIANRVVAEAENELSEKLAGEIEIETEVRLGSPKVKIVAAAEEFGADIIVMGSHGYGLIERVLLGSVSQSVLNHAPCSVLVIRSE